MTMDNTLAQILNELYRVTAEAQKLRARVDELEAAQKTPPDLTVVTAV